MRDANTRARSTCLRDPRIRKGQFCNVPGRRRRGCRRPQPRSPRGCNERRRHTTRLVTCAAQRNGVGSALVQRLIDERRGIPRASACVPAVLRPRGSASGTGSSEGERLACQIALAKIAWTHRIAASDQLRAAVLWLADLSGAAAPELRTMPVREPRRSCRHSRPSLRDPSASSGSNGPSAANPVV